jgi:geranylgeranyl diphosphate synthase type II
MTYNDLLDARFANLDLPESPASLYDPIRYTIALGGKRIRPKLVCLACALNGGQATDAVEAGVAVELLHNFTLIHDDIMDNADTRRGQPTVFRKWSPSIAILSGDALFTVSIARLNAYAAHPSFAAMNAVFLDGILKVCEGQAYDMEFESRTDVTLEEYLTMIELKTSVLLQKGMELGAMVAGASDEDIRITGDVGLNAGLAFQIQDDLMDAIADPKKFGKKVCGDIREGKKTFLTLALLERCAADEQAYVMGILQQKSATDDDVKRMLELYAQYGIFELANGEIRRLYDQALALLAHFPESPARHEIIALLNQLMHRES